MHDQVLHDRHFHGHVSRTRQQRIIERDAICVLARGQPEAQAEQVACFPYGPDSRC